MQLDYVDSFVLHWPQACPATGTGVGVCREPHTNQPTPASEGASMFPVGEDGYYVSDDDCHFVETWKATEELVDEGLEGLALRAHLCDTETSSMARTTGYTCTAMVNLVAEGLWDEPGLAPPEVT